MLVRRSEPQTLLAAKAARLGLVVLFSAIFANVTIATQAQAKAEAASIQRDSKLSSLLRELRDQFPQRMGPIEPSQREYMVSAVHSHSFSKAIADALDSRVLRISNQAEVQAYIEIDEITPSHLEALQSLGVRIEVQADPHKNPSNRRVYSSVPTLQAEIPIESIQQVENLLFVRYVHLPYYAEASTGSVTSQGDHLLQADAVRQLMNVDGTGISVGVISSGIGGIFATGCTSCGPAPNTPTSPSPITLGDLPAATGARINNVLTSVSGGITAAQSYLSPEDLEDTLDGPNGAEGTAMLEIVHDLAPGASLSFANAGTDLEMEQAVNALAAANNVVVDDLSFYEPSYDGTSNVSTNTAEALNNSANPIRAYITAAGNHALNHYSGAFIASSVDGLLYTGQIGALQLFSGVPNSGPAQPDVNLPPYQTIDTVNLGNEPFDPLLILPADATAEVRLSWNDKVGASSNDYDLFLVPLSCTQSHNGLPAGNCSLSGQKAVASSTNPQTGTQNPLESITYKNSTGGPLTLGIVIQNVGNKANPVVFDMFTPGYGAKQTIPNHNFNTISGSVPAQSDTVGSPASVITVGAIDESQCASPDNCSGLVEAYSGQGPTQTTPVTSTAYNKPNIVAVDQVCITGAGGFGNAIPNGVSCPVAPPAAYTPMIFGGTSAAAPHVAAIAALTLQMAPCLLYSNGSQSAAVTRQILYNALTGGSPPGLTPPTLSFPSPLPGYLLPLPNNAEGYGLVDALTSATGMLPVPAAPASNLTSATSANGASVNLAAGKATSNLSGCQTVAMQWNGGCGTGETSATQATVQCPIGISPVTVSISINGRSFLPPSELLTSNVIVADFAISSSSYSATPVVVSPGSPAIFTIQVVSTGQGPFTNPVALACSASGLPPGATCLFSPVTVTPATISNTGVATAIAAASSLTIYTSGVASSARRRALHPFSRSLTSISFASPFLVFGLACFSRRRRRMLALHLGVGVILVVTCLGISNCGTSNKTAPTATTYSVMITGTSNQLVHTTNVMLTVQ